MRPFALDHLPVELQVLVLDEIALLSPADISRAARTCTSWHARLTRALYASVLVSKSSREGVFSGLGLSFPSASILELHAGTGAAVSPCGLPTPPASPCTPTHASFGKTWDSDYSGSGLFSKSSALGHVTHLSIGDTPGALAVAEALLHHPGIFASVDEVSLGAPLFRHLVNSVAGFGRPRSGAAFVGETLVAHLRPRHVRIEYPAPRGRARGGAGVFDPVLLARLMAVLHVEWRPESVDYYGVVADLPPVLGKNTRIHCGPCVRDSDLYADEDEHHPPGCAAHAHLVRMHLRRTFGSHAHDELLDAIAEGADPEDEDDLDPDDVPRATHARVEYHGVPCIAALQDRDAFLRHTFRYWPVEVDVGSQVEFFA